MIGEQKRLQKILESKREEEMDMCQAIDELIADGEVRGILMGMEKTKINFIRKQYKKQLSSGQIADILDLDERYVEKVIKLFKQYPAGSDDEIAGYL